MGEDSVDDVNLFVRFIDSIFESIYFLKFVNISTSNR